MSLIIRRGALAAALLFSLFSGTARAGIAEFLGNWINNDGNTPDITRVVVMPGGPGGVMVHVWAQCYPTDCDWGVVPGHPYVDTFNQHDVNIVTASFNPGFARTLVILRAGPFGMKIQALTEFTDGSGRSDYEYRGNFHRVAFFPPLIPMPQLPPIPLPLQPKWPPAMPTPQPLPITPQPVQPGFPQPLQPVMPHPILLGAEDCIGFNTNIVNAMAVGGVWKVMSGPVILLSFGNDQAGAYRAVHLIKTYGLSQQCFVRRPHAAMMYWKSGGSVPKNNLPNQDCLGNNPMTTTVSNFGGSWKIVDGPHAILDFGADKAAADMALSVIKFYRLDRQCFVARPNPPMTYWLAQ